MTDATMKEMVEELDKMSEELKTNPAQAEVSDKATLAVPPVMETRTYLYAGGNVINVAGVIGVEQALENGDHILQIADGSKTAMKGGWLSVNFKVDTPSE